jgi:hypothetical protein
MTSVEWYTPAKYIEAAREVMGGIDLDPASCAQAQMTVKADCWFGPGSSCGEDGLTQEWRGNVWLNPPYGKTAGKSNAGRWIDKLLREYDAGRVDQAILLVNAQTAEQWFKPLWRFPLCFTDHRIKFVSPTGVRSQPTHGNVFVFVGVDDALFKRVFAQFGAVVRGRWVG